MEWRRVALVMVLLVGASMMTMKGEGGPRRHGRRRAEAASVKSIPIRPCSCCSATCQFGCW